MSFIPNPARRMTSDSKIVSRVQPTPCDTDSTSDRSPEESPDWLILQIQARFERRVSDQLVGQNRQAFVPVARERRRWTDRYQTIELPMFPGYVFVRAVLKAADRVAILQSSGVFGFVTFNGSMARVSDPQIRYLRKIAEQQSTWSPYRFVADGPRVRVRGGHFDGVEGILANDKAGTKLVMSIEPMQRSIAVSIEGCDCERL